MRHTSRYNIAKCSINITCKKCSSIANPIVVNRGTHSSLYCAECGAYIKHASAEEKKYIYVNHVKVEDGTPMKVYSLYIESSNTMFR